MKVEEQLFSYLPFAPNEGQQLAIKLMLSFLSENSPRSAFVLKGYAGTGKTSLTRALVEWSRAGAMEVRLLAPTGRAAKVLSAYTAHPAFTIHKEIYVLRSSPDGRPFFALKNNFAKNTLYIVDEASMISNDAPGWGSQGLLDDLIQYVEEGRGCRLLLIGDGAQLPPIGTALSPALDIDYLEARFKIKVWQAELTEVMRQKGESGILENATAIRMLLNEEEAQIPKLTISADVQAVADAYQLEDWLNEAFAGKEDEHAIIICRSNKNAVQYNKEIRNRIFYRDERLSAGDRLMVTRNNYLWLTAHDPKAFIANGDMVEVLKVSSHHSYAGMDFAKAWIRMNDMPGNPELDVMLHLEGLDYEGASISAEKMKQLYDTVKADLAEEGNMAERRKKIQEHPYLQALVVKFGWAVTCHKAQGGQWPVVFVENPYLPEGPDKEYLRWLYTAFTRATERLCLIGFQKQVHDVAG
jgi:exodeoxyribonuclease-5